MESSGVSTFPNNPPIKAKDEQGQGYKEPFFVGG
jgi:hypothetical protein